MKRSRLMISSPEIALQPPVTRNITAMTLLKRDWYGAGGGEGVVPYNLQK